MDSNPVLIIGGGIAGLTTAYYLHRRGVSVCVVDAGQIGQESTWAGGGILSTVPPWTHPKPINQLLERSQTLYSTLIDDLEQRTHQDCELHASGLMLVGEPDPAALPWLERHRVRYQIGRVAEFEPHLKRDEPALLLPDILQLRNSRLAAAFRIWLNQRGIAHYEDLTIEHLLHDRGQILGATTSCGRQFRASNVILAAGAWTDRILQRSRLSTLGIEPVRGQMLLFKPDAVAIRHILNSPLGYLIPRRDGRILAGTTVEQAGFDRRPSHSAYDRILNMVRHWCPSIGPEQLELQWTGFRPGVIDGLPKTGPHRQLNGLWVQSAGYRNG
ncbi:MAG: FAD-dependent oxidoreductase, partial [Pseudomonadota bacterium]